jgi:hypothetical protein
LTAKGAAGNQRQGARRTDRLRALILRAVCICKIATLDLRDAMTIWVAVETARSVHHALSKPKGLAVCFVFT